MERRHVHALIKFILLKINLILEKDIFLFPSNVENIPLEFGNKLLSFDVLMYYLYISFVHIVTLVTLWK